MSQYRDSLRSLIERYGKVNVDKSKILDEMMEINDKIIDGIQKAILFEDVKLYTPNYGRYDFGVVFETNKIFEDKQHIVEAYNKMLTMLRIGEYILKIEESKTFTSITNECYSTVVCGVSNYGTLLQFSYKNLAQRNVHTVNTHVGRHVLPNDYVDIIIFHGGSNARIISHKKCTATQEPSLVSSMWIFVKELCEIYEMHLAERYSGVDTIPKAEYEKQSKIMDKIFEEKRELQQLVALKDCEISMLKKMEYENSVKIRQLILENKRLKRESEAANPKQ